MVWNEGNVGYTDFGSVEVTGNTGDAAGRSSEMIGSGEELFE
jgi:hypothetical protein